MYTPFATALIPHRYCMGLDGNLIWLSVVTDALVALSYYSIPAALFLLVYKRRQSITVQPILILFGLFIAFCGAGHFMDIVSLWKPIYWIKAWWNVGTATTSVITAIMLVPQVLEIVRMPETAATLKRKNLELEERQSLLRAVLDATDEGFVLVDDRGETILFNTSAEKILAAPNRGVQSDRDAESKGLQGKPRIPWGAGVAEEISRHPNGKLVAHSSREVPGFGVLFVLRDITEQRAAEEQRRRLEHIVQTMRQGFSVISSGNIIVSTNPTFDAMYGHATGELAGRQMKDLLQGSDEERAQTVKQILTHALQEEFWEGETLNRRADGTGFIASMRLNAHRTGEQTLFSLIQMDITEEKRVAAESKRLQEKMLQTAKLESVGILAGGIAHDFNNLLTGILGNTSLVYDQLPPSSGLRNFLSSAIRASERAADLTRQLLAYSGKGQFVLEPIELNALIREIGDLVKMSVPPHVEVLLALGNDLQVEADIGQMQQLFMNLVINGAEAVPEGQTGHLVVTTSSETLTNEAVRSLFANDGLRPGEYAVVAVQDDGCGMDPVTQSQIFDPFFTTKFTGRGLGLAAVTGIARGHQGAVKVYSEVGKGSLFRVYLPLVNGKETTANLDAWDRGLLHGKGTILIVDDEESVRNGAQSTLEFYGYSVLTAENGKRGVEVFQEFVDSISMVLLDLTMPVMNGDEAMKAIRAIREDVPVMLSSGFNESQALRKFAGLRLNGFLQKPYTSSKLAEKVRTLLTGVSG